MPSFPNHLLAAVLCLGLSACAAPQPSIQDPSGPWVSALGRDHPLSGRIWSPSQSLFVSSDQVRAQAAEADFVLLGEKHDNEDHHRIQAWVTGQIFAQGRRPVLAFEMITDDQTQALGDAIARRPRDATGLGAALGWERSGWPAWRQYRPIAQAALDAGAPILPAGLSRPTIRAIGKEGARALGERREKLLALDKPMPDELTKPLRRAIVEAHCGQLPATMIGPMTTVMQVRDAHMAGVLIEGASMAGRDGAVLITGKGHARLDYAVPFHLRRLAPGRRILSIAMIEVAPDETGPASYAARFSAKALPYDFVWFTPYPEREPPCERFADQLRKAKQRHQKQREAD